MARILIADDSSIMRRNLKTILTQAGHSVVYEAANGEEACRGYEETLPDLVTMDITMPVLGGIDAVKAITRQHPDARIIMISAFDQRSMLFEAMESGAPHYIIKPITGDKLLGVIEQTLETSPSMPVSAAAQTGSEAAPSLPSQPEPTASVSIENRDGKFWIRFMPAADYAPQLQTVRGALQGLLFIKPLTVVWDLLALEHMDTAAARELQELIGLVRNAGGTVEVLSGNIVL